MARYIDLPDNAKGKLQRQDAARVDWVAEKVRIESEAKKVKELYSGKQADRMIARLRIEWAAAHRAQYFVATGKNLQHVGLSA